MTKEDIKKALKCCSNPSISSCKDCPYANYDEFDCCNGKMYKDALNLITEQEKEIERLKEKCKKLSNEKCNAQDELDCYYDEMPNKIKRAKIDVLNELKKKTHNYYPSIDSYCISQHIVLVRDIDELIKEIENETKKETSRSTL